MVIVCQNCQTRFNLAAERIPSGGAKVRCSKCQNSFHVKPPASSKPDPASFLGLPSEDEVGPEPQAAAPAPEPPIVDEDLRPPRNDPPMATVFEDEADEPVFGAPAEKGQDLRGNPLTDAERAAAAEAAADPDADPLDSWDPFEEIEEEEAEAEAAAAPPPEERRRLPADRSKLFDAPMTDGDDEWADEPHPIPEVSNPTQTVVEESGRRGEDGDGDLDPMGRSSWIPQALASLVGMALIAGGIQAQLRVMSPVPGPERVQGVGWTASEVVLRHVEGPGGRTDALGLEVMGKLESSGQQTPPRPIAKLLDARGQELPGTWSGQVEYSAAGRVAGFRIVIPDSPPTARRFRVELQKP